MGPFKYDYNFWLITLTVITLSGFNNLLNLLFYNETRLSYQISLKAPVSAIVYYF